ncbi:MAG: hypothetical protein HY335_06480 [Deinococcus sp.]|nr:hypothetical protein [Deinococcus sp.]
MALQYRTRWLLLLALLTLYGAYGQAGIPAVLTITGNQQFPGEVAEPTLNLTTPFVSPGPLFIDFQFIKRLDVGTPSRVTFLNGDVLLGRIENPGILFSTEFGTASIPLEMIRSLEVDTAPTDTFPPGQVLVALPDGQQVTGTLAAPTGDTVTFAMSFGQLEIRPEELSRLIRAPGSTNLTVVTRAGSRITGAGTVPELLVQAEYGELRMPGETIRTFMGIPVSVPLFGTSADGDLVATGTVVIDQVKSAVFGVNLAGQRTLQVRSSAGFTAGDEVLIISMQDPESNLSRNVAGQYEIHFITAVSGNTLTIDAPLTNTYNTSNGQKHQVLRVPNYINVAVRGRLTASAWNGETGGIVFLRALESVEIDLGGLVTVAGDGFRGGAAGVDGGGVENTQGESWTRLGLSAMSSPNGGGGGTSPERFNPGGGGGGSYGASGSNGQGNAAGLAGNLYGFTDLRRLYLGSGGGGGRNDDEDNNRAGGGLGGAGGGIVVLFAPTIVVNGNITASGNDGLGGNDLGDEESSGGGGSGGSILIVAEVLRNSGAIRAGGGVSLPGNSSALGGTGGAGRIRIDVRELAGIGAINPAPFRGTFSEQ